jgi:simple sugar transport system ATP-binding protein
VDVLSSLLRLDSGTVEVAGRSVATGVAGAMHAAGVAVIPEDRHLSGVVLPMTIAENLALGSLSSVTTRGFLREAKLKERARDLMAEYGIAAPSLDLPVAALSGGNQQRVVLARELSSGPRVLIAAQPTRGLDVAAIEYVNKRLRRAAEEGTAVLLISSELEEVLSLADRIAVMSQGRIIGEMPGHDVDMDRLSLLIGGHAG